MLLPLPSDNERRWVEVVERCSQRATGRGESEKGDIDLDSAFLDGGEKVAKASTRINEQVAQSRVFLSKIRRR